MKSFFKTLLASILGVIIGSTLLLLLGISIIAGIASMGESSSYKLEDKTVLKINLDGVLNERKDQNPLAAIFGDVSMGLDDILDAIKKAQENDEIKGIYIKAGHFDTGIANLEPIRNALLEFKQSGKFVVAYSDNYMQNTYYIASVADKVIMNPQGMLDFHGLASTPMFVRGMYEKMGVKYQVFKVGTFKSAVEPYIQDKMSEPNREQVTSFMGDVWSHLLKGISESRKISVDDLNKYADQCLMFSPADSILQYNMVDTLMYETSIDTYLKTLTATDADDKLKLASVGNLAKLRWKDKPNSKDKIAVLYAEGVIVDDEQGSPLFGGNMITAKQYVKELQKLKDDKTVKAVVFRVNSGGGSAYASEQIWNAVVELKKEKPVVVSMGDYAASGGYYIACAANTIIAEPTTLTGSIGIFGLIPEGEELAKKMGVSFDEVKTNKHAAFGGRPFGIPFIVSAYSRTLNDDESRLLQKYIERGYDLFTTRCAEGRSKTKAEIDSIGQGRVWTGNQALKLGLVDKLGGVNDAIKVAAELAKLEDYKLNSYPAPKDMFKELFSESMGAVQIKALKTFMGEDAYNNRVLMQNVKSTDIQMAIMPERLSY